MVDFWIQLQGLVVLPVSLSAVLISSLPVRFVSPLLCEVVVVRRNKGKENE